MNLKRLRRLKNGQEKTGPVVYWMSRDQRVHDNWALLYAQKLALEKNTPLLVIFNLVTDFLEATLRQYAFMINGLKELELELRKYSIPFHLLQGKPENKIPVFIKENNCSILVTDFDPLRVKINWKEKVVNKIDIPLYEIDAHNIIPCFYVSDKVEFAAHTIRPKIHKLLPEFLDDFPPLKKMRKSLPAKGNKINWDSVISSLKINKSVKEVEWINPGEKAAFNY